jgi:hypothetical protein
MADGPAVGCDAVSSSLGVIYLDRIVGVADDLTPAMRTHIEQLQELWDGTGYAAWTPETAGEWSIARALESRGYLRRDPARGTRAYEYTGKLIPPP